jgi:RHS repeat-associated protein
MLGDTTNPNPAQTAATNLLYSGEQFDANAQQYYLRARYYNQNNGTFNQVDLYAGNTQDPQSLHKYAYCHNNPVNAIDPSGLIQILPHLRKFFKHFSLNHGLRILIGIAATYFIGYEYIAETGADVDSVTINRQIARLSDLKDGKIIKWIADYTLRPDIVDEDRQHVYEIKPDIATKIIEGKLQINRYIGVLNIRYPEKMFVPGTWIPRSSSLVITQLPGIIGLPTIHISVRNAGWGVIAYEINIQDLNNLQGLLLVGITGALTLKAASFLAAQSKMYPELVRVRSLVRAGVI